jgi:hypothetical protein
MEQNPAFEAALDTAFTASKQRQGKAPLVFEEGVCEIVLTNGNRTDRIELHSGSAEVHFFHSDRANYGAGSVDKDNTRGRKWYIITFEYGSLSVDERPRTSQISYKPSMRPKPRRSSTAGLLQLNI